MVRQAAVLTPPFLFLLGIKDPYGCTKCTAGHPDMGVALQHPRLQEQGMMCFAMLFTSTVCVNLRTSVHGLHYRTSKLIRQFDNYAMINSDKSMKTEHVSVSQET